MPTIAIPIITALYAGLLGLVSLGVSFPAGSLRGKLGVVVGDGGNKDLLLAMRRHANFVEYVPLALLLIALLEMNGVASRYIHILGAVLLIARLAHAFGIKVDTMKTPGRMVGAVGTMLVTLVSSGWLVVLFANR
jgi:uncharacterized membrane protein YecN with MAPEG domain